MKILTIKQVCLFSLEFYIDIFLGALLGTIIARFTKYKQNVLEEKVFKEELGMNMSVDKKPPK